MKPFRQIVNGELQIAFHPGQMKTYNSIRRFVAMIAGTQGGKTCIGPVWLHQEITRKGAGDYLAVTANYDLSKLKMLPELLGYFCTSLNIGHYWAGSRVIELAEDLIPGKFLAKTQDDQMWGRIIIRSAEAEAGLESATAKAAWLDEAGHPDFSRTAWEAIQRRLSINQGRCLFTTTLYDWGWFKVEIYDRWLAGDKDYDVIQFDSTVNPAFPREEYKRAKRTMPAWKFALFYQGRYEKPAGLIYDCFDEGQCKVSRFEVSGSWPRFVGHDFGPVHTAALWYAQDTTTGYLYLYREYLSESKMSAAEHVKEWQRLSKDEPIRKRVGGAGGNQAADEGWRQAFALAGWPVSQPLVESVEAGIDRVYAWHKTDRLYIFEDCLGYLGQKMSYSRELDDRYEPTDKIHNQSVYHYMDAERYILADFMPVNAVRAGQKDKVRVLSY